MDLSPFRRSDVSVRGRSRARRRLVKSWRVVAPLLVIGLLMFAVRGADWHRLFEALRAAHWKWVLVAAVLNLFVNNSARVFRFSVLLNFLLKRRLWEVVRASASTILSTRAFNTLVPARAGEAFRIARLRRRLQTSVENVLAAVVVEPLIEGMSMAMPAILLLFFFPAPVVVVRALVILLAGVALGVVLLLFSRIGHEARAARLADSPPAVHRRFFARFVVAVTTFASWRVWVGAVSCSMISDVTDLAMIGLCLAAVGVHVGIAGWIAILLIVNVAIAVPAVPGNLGTLEAGAVVALGILGITDLRALAFGLLYHVAHSLPVLLGGAAALLTDWAETLKRQG